jgi:hypothetical protein
LFWTIILGFRAVLESELAQAYLDLEEARSVKASSGRFKKVAG